MRNHEFLALGGALALAASIGSAASAQQTATASGSAWRPLRTELGCEMVSKVVGDTELRVSTSPSVPKYQMSVIFDADFNLYAQIELAFDRQLLMGNQIVRVYPAASGAPQHSANVSFFPRSFDGRFGNFVRVNINGDDKFVDWVSRNPEFYIVINGRTESRVYFAGVEEALRVLQSCLPLVAPPNREVAAIGNIARWLEIETWNVEPGTTTGPIGAELTISREGRVAYCRITKSLGRADLDKRFCDALIRRGKFRPATDANGNLISSKFPFNLKGLSF